MVNKQRVFEIIEKAGPGDRASRIFDIVIVVLIVLNVAAVVANSFTGLPEPLVHGLWIFEIGSVALFSVEYVLRVWTADLLYPGSKMPRFRHVLSFMALIDLFSILPFYLPLLIPVDLRFMRMLRLMRLFRIFKLHRYNSALEVFGKVLHDEKEKLLTTLLFTTVLLIFSSSVMYYVENEAQPDKFPNIIASVWWAVATLTTVGYGDVYPVTVLGKLLSGLIAILGIGLVALPAGIISSGFILGVGRKDPAKPVKCPHCGEWIEHPDSQ